VAVMNPASNDPMAAMMMVYDISVFELKKPAQTIEFA